MFYCKTKRKNYNSIRNLLKSNLYLRYEREKSNRKRLYNYSSILGKNDGDNYNTITKVVETKEQAERIQKMCKELFVSCNNGKGGVGNSMDMEQIDRVIEYLENNQKDFPDLEEITDEEEIFDYFLQEAYDLMGGSEYYDFRVCQSCTVTYSDKDIYLEEVKF